MEKVPASHHTEKEVEQEVYLTWTSPSRLFKKRDKEYFTNIGAIVFLLAVILIIAKEFVLVAAVFSIVFLVYVLSTVPPEDISHRITNLGIESGEHFYRWDSLKECWYEEKWGQTLIMIQPLMGSRIIILLGKDMKVEVRELITKHIPFREQPEKSWIENASTWLSEKIPLEKTS